MHNLIIDFVTFSCHIYLFPSDPTLRTGSTLICCLDSLSLAGADLCLNFANRIIIRKYEQLLKNNMNCSQGDGFPNY